MVLEITLSNGAPRDRVNEPPWGLELDSSKGETPLTVVRIVSLGGDKRLDYVELAKLHWTGGLSPKEIAKTMGKSINTIHWAIRKLKQEKVLNLALEEELKAKTVQRTKN